MKASQLRQSILQIAMQGKLVPQNPHDEPASALLECIQAEKDHLIKEGKIKKEKVLPIGTGDEVYYELPEGWKWTRLGHITITSHSGWSPQCLPHRRSEEEWGVLKVSAVSWGIFKPEENKALPTSIQPKTEFAVQMGDFLISRANTDELVARSVVVDDDVKNLMLSDKIVRFHLSENVDKYFINNANLSPLSRHHYIKHASGTSSSMKNVSREVMLNLPIPLPPIAEQQRIVAKLNELMALCDELEAAEKEFDSLEANLAEYLPKSILQAAVQGKLVPQSIHDEPASELLKRIHAEKFRLIKGGKIKKEKPLPPISEEEIPYDLPGGWEWCRLSNLGEIIGGSTPDSANTDYYTAQGTGIPWVTPADMKTVTNNTICYGAKDITQKGFDSCSTQLLPKDSILFSSRAPIGLIAFSGAPLCTNQGFKSIVSYLPELKNWIFYSLKQRTDNIISRAPGTTFKEVSGKFMENELIPVPPLAEQQRIVAKIDELMALCEQLKNIDPDNALPPADMQQVLPPMGIPTSSEPEEQYAMAARGDVSTTETKEHRQAIEDLFGDGADG